MEKIYLIGGSGFIGKNLATFFSENYEVSVFDKYIDDKYFLQHPLIKTYLIDLVDEKISRELDTPDYIVNLASIVTAERNFSLFDELISSNLKVLINLFERFKGEDRLKLFIQFGSSEEYGNVGSPFNESMREIPNSPYALVKQLTVNTAIMLNNNYGFPSMAVRPGNLFGNLQNKNKFIPYIISQLKEHNPLNVTPCEQKRDFINITDFSYLLGQLLLNYSKCKGQIVNISSGESISLRDVIEICKKEIGSSSKINYGALPYRKNETMDLKCNITKLEKIIGKNINISIEKSLIRYIRH